MGGGELVPWAHRDLQSTLPIELMTMIARQFTKKRKDLEIKCKCSQIISGELDKLREGN